MVRTRWLPLVVVIALAAPAGRAAADDDYDDVHLRPQIQADLGLSVIGLAYEHPLASHVAVQVSGHVFSTYYAPWFDVGDRVDGFGGEVRPTLFLHHTGHGIYVAPYLRVDRVTGKRDGASGHAFGYAAGVFAGWVFAVGHRLDIRVGGGVQYIHYVVDTSAGKVDCTTPFIALDLVVGVRL